MPSARHSASRAVTLYEVRNLRWTLPIGLLFALAGVYLLISAGAPRGDAPPLGSIPVTRHVVDEKMERLTGSWARRQAPSIQTTDATGRGFDSQAQLANGPIFVYFIKEDCPCSVDAQPLFNRLRNKFKGKAAFVGVIDVDAPKGRAWASRNSMTDPMVPDPTRKLIHAFKATNSAFSALVLPDGTIDKMWPGYSREYLLDMNRHLSAALGEKETTLDIAYAPLSRTAGCSFE